MSRSGRFTPCSYPVSMVGVGGWVGPRAGLDGCKNLASPTANIIKQIYSFGPTKSVVSRLRVYQMFIIHVRRLQTVFFFIFCWPCILIYLFINIHQLDALNFIIILFQASTCFENMCSSSGGQNCIIQSLVSSHLYVAVPGQPHIGVMIPDTV